MLNIWTYIAIFLDYIYDYRLPEDAVERLLATDFTIPGFSLTNQSTQSYLIYFYTLVSQDNVQIGYQTQK